MRKLLIVAIVFIVLGIVLISIYYYIFPTLYVKGIFSLQPNQSKSLAIPYSSFIFEYKDNVTSPLRIGFESAIITNYTESDSIFIYYGSSSEGIVTIENNYSHPILIGYSIVNDSPLLIFLPFLLYLGIGVIIIGVLTIILLYTLLK